MKKKWIRYWDFIVSLQQDLNFVEARDSRTLKQHNVLSSTNFIDLGIPFQCFIMILMRLCKQLDGAQKSIVFLFYAFLIFSYRYDLSILLRYINQFITPLSFAEGQGDSALPFHSFLITLKPKIIFVWKVFVYCFLRALLMILKNASLILINILHKAYILLLQGLSETSSAQKMTSFFQNHYFY